MKNALYVLAIVQLAFVSTIFAAPATKDAALNMAMVNQYVKAQTAISRGMSSKTPDWTEIMAQFELTMPVIKDVDAKYKKHYSKEIRDALKKCAAGGQEYAINSQIVGKGYQHITVLAIQKQLDYMEKASSEEMKSSAEKVAAYFEVIRPTLARRDKGFFEGKKTLEAAADDAIAKLLKADKGELLTASRELEDVIARTYALSMLYEIKEVEKKRDSDPQFCEVKRTEASMFYRIIQPRIEKRSPKINVILVNILKGSIGAMNSADVEKYLSEGLEMKLR
jgi:hypothetical protein